MNRTVALAAGVGLLVSWLLHRTFRKKNKAIKSPPAVTEKWQHIGQLQEIVFYPMKSGAAVELQEAVCDEQGLSSHCFRDRNLVLMAEDGRIAYAGTHPKMLSIAAKLVDDNVICLTAPNAESLTLDIAELTKDAKIIEKPMHGYRMRLVECRAEHHKWFSQVILERDEALTLYIQLERIMDTSWWRNFSPEVFPIMVLHKKTVEDLNTRLLPENKVHHQQFRGNLYVDSLPTIRAYDEDRWLWLKIGSDEGRTIIMRYNSDCFRCILVNIDIKTCKRNANFEPLKTLKKYRCLANPKEPSMGRYYDIVNTGVLKKGDPVYVLYEESNK